MYSGVAETISTGAQMTRAALVLLASMGVAAGANDFDKAIGTYLQQHCLRCHSGGKDKKSDFRIDTLSKDVGIKDSPLWAEVMERISSGEMPPKEVKNRPTAEQGAAVVEWLAAKIKEGEAARLAARGPVAYYRLSREEYVNTIYDLFGVHYDAADPGGLTEDPEWHGFERIGSVMTLSPSHIEKYFQAAESVLAEAYPEKASAPIDVRNPMASSKNVPEPHRTRLLEAGLLDKVRYEMWPGDKRGANPGRLPVSGVYEVSVQLSGLKPADGRAPRLKLYHERLDRTLFEGDVIAPEGKPVVVTFRTHLPEGNQDIQLFNDVPGPSNLPRSGRHGRRPFVSIKDGRMAWQIKLTDEDGNALYPFLIVDWVQWKGPIIEPHEAKRRADYMPTRKGDMAQVRAGLEKLARRAFRRPLREGEVDAYVKLVEKEIASGSEFFAAVKTGMLGILCSKSFLFLEEGSAKADRKTLDNWELASRLSYFLWSTMPDDELFAAAEKGTLQDKAELRRQTARMLADPKARRFADSFARQWLQLRRVGMFAPDKNLYPDYDEHLEKSMVGETTAFFAEVLDKNLSLREFLDSDWTMVNARLAMHYGVPNIEGDRFQRVALRPQDHRGGLLTQASILSLTSDGTRHRPVHRGVWVSESIFGVTPPPPPANVDPIEPNPVDSPKATLRMKLDAHKANASCASCHRKIDPLGFAFDNYDAIGRWRTEEVVPQGKGDNPKVDASGKLPDGREFADSIGFKRLLVDELDTFNATFVKKLATYGLRRSLTLDDKTELAKISAAGKAAKHEVRSVVEALVLSDLFRSR